MKKLLAIILSLGLIITPIQATHASESGGYAKQILGIANGVVGSSIITKCVLASMQPSLMAYMAGSLVYIFAEITGGQDQKKNMSNQSDTLNNLQATMTEGGDYQKGVIDAQLADEKKNLEHIQKRRKWIMAVKVIYGIATALAILEFIRSVVPPYITDQAACTPNPASDEMLTKALTLAYSGLNGYAGGGMMGAAMAVAAPMIAQTLAQFFFAVDIATKIANGAITMLSSSIGRIVFFAAATVLVMMIDSALAEEESKSQQKIADLEKIKAQFNLQTQTTISVAEGSSTDSTSAQTSGAGSGTLDDATKKEYALTALPQGSEMKKSCFTKSASGGTEYSEEGCKKPLVLNRPTFNAKMIVPTLSTGANSAIDMANAISSGDMAKANVEAGNLASMAGRVDSINKNLMKKLNDDLKAKGKKPIDINGELQRQVTALNQALNQKNPGSGNYSLGDAANVGAASTSAAEKVADAAAVPTVSAPAAVVIDPAAGIDLSGIEAAANNALSDSNALGLGANGKVASLSDSLDGYESNENDISKDPGVSIFKQVSNRYFLNYTKIFQRKEISPPMAVPEPVR